MCIGPSLACASSAEISGECHCAEHAQPRLERAQAKLAHGSESWSVAPPSEVAEVSRGYRLAQRRGLAQPLAGLVEVFSDTPAIVEEVAEESHRNGVPLLDAETRESMRPLVADGEPCTYHLASSACALG